MDFGIVSGLRGSNISGYGYSAFPHCWGEHTSSNVQLDPLMAVGFGPWVGWSCSGDPVGWFLIGWGEGGPIYPLSTRLSYSSIVLPLGVGGVGGLAACSTAGRLLACVGSPPGGIIDCRLVMISCIPSAFKS